jgi:hypothetical protein
LEIELPLRLFDKRKEERLEPRLKKAHVVMVDFRRDVIGGSVMERSQASHTYNNGIVMQIALASDAGLQKMLRMF